MKLVVLLAIVTSSVFAQTKTPEKKYEEVIDLMLKNRKTYLNINQGDTYKSKSIFTDTLEDSNGNSIECTMEEVLTKTVLSKTYEFVYISSIGSTKSVGANPKCSELNSENELTVDEEHIYNALSLDMVLPAKFEDYTLTKFDYSVSAENLLSINMIATTDFGDISFNSVMDLNRSAYMNPIKSEVKFGTLLNNIESNEFIKKQTLAELKEIDLTSVTFCPYEGAMGFGECKENSDLSYLLEEESATDLF